MPARFPLYDGPAPHSQPGGEQPSLIVFPAPRPAPTILVLPGGGYYVRAEHEGEPIARWLNSIGLSAVVVHYRVHPHRHPVPLADAQRAVRLARAHAASWSIDPDRIGVLGFSAGGHLAAAVANFGADGDPQAADPVERASARVQACVPCYAVITAGPHGHQGSFQALLGEQPEPALRERMSLERSVTPANPPTFIWHTADDQAVPVQNALLYATALVEAKVPVALHVYPRAPHGIGLGFDFPGTARTWTTALADWLQEIGFR